MGKGKSNNCDRQAMILSEATMVAGEGKEAETKSALICVDVQPDFMPGGALAVPNGDQVIGPLVEAMSEVDVVVASRDWHPADHMSFAEQGGPWPPHCVADTPGAQIAPEIESRADIVVSKATDKDTDAYSAFEGTDLASQLHNQNVHKVVVGGLATDYCVKATVLSAIKEGFEVEVLSKGMRGVEVNPGDCAAAIEEMKAAGARIR